MSKSSTAMLLENTAMSIPRSNPAVYSVQFDLNDNSFPAFINAVYDTPVGQSLFTNPRDWVVSMYLFPFKFRTGEKGSFVFPKGQTFEDVLASVIGQQLLFQCVGSYYYSPKFNNFADYNGYTKVLLYLPYYGYIEISPNDIINKWINVFIQIDTINGQACYYICSSNEKYNLGSVGNLAIGNYQEVEIFNNRILATYTFQLGSPIPLGSSNAAEMNRNIALGVLKIAGTAVMTYAFGAAGLGVSTSTSTTFDKFTRRNEKTGRQITDSTMTSTEKSSYDYSNQVKMHGISNCFATAMDTLNSAYLRGNGDVVNNPNLLLNGSQSIQLIRLTPKIKETPSSYNTLYGKPLGEIRTLQNVRGYTEISSVHIEGELFENATLDEIEMLESILTAGVIL